MIMINKDKNNKFKRTDSDFDYTLWDLDLQLFVDVKFKYSLFMTLIYNII